MLFLDPTYLCLGGDDHGDVFKQGLLLRRIGDMCRELGVTLIMAHHYTKAKAIAKDRIPVLEDLSMAGFSEFARQWFLIVRCSEFLPGTPHDLSFVAGGSAGHHSHWDLEIFEGDRKDEGGRVWDINIQTREALMIISTKVHALLKSNLNGMTKNAISKATIVAPYDCQ